ncbi:MAG: LPS sulfotransferase NodH [Alphaproteobacteria bacterium]|jgi:LPS sulfotransferase NodH
MALPHTSDPEFDLAPQEPPAFRYIIAATPRVGSTFPSKLMWETGTLGCPAEYFNYNKVMFRLIARFAVESPEEYLQALFRFRTTPNGVFGLKLHYDHLQFLSISGLLRRLGELKILRIVRNDPVSEAISFSRAIQTNSWASFSAENTTVATYNTDHLNWCAQHLHWQKQSWDQFFNSQKLPHLTIEYQSLITDPTATIRYIQQSLGFPNSPKLDLKLPEMTRQSDASRLDWIERYKRDPKRILP